jgi:regulator of protease activity HflC (stomatin/prohibitin superfamily)
MPCSIDGVVFFKVNDPEKKQYLKVENFNFAITQLCTSCFRDVAWKK